MPKYEWIGPCKSFIFGRQRYENKYFDAILLNRTSPGNCLILRWTDSYNVSFHKKTHKYIYILYKCSQKNNTSSGVWIDFVWFPNIGVFRRENFQLSPGPFDFIHFCWVAGTKFQGDPGEGLSEKSHGSLGIGIQDGFTMYPSLKLTTWRDLAPEKWMGWKIFSNRLEYDFVSFWGKRPIFRGVCC